MKFAALAAVTLVALLGLYWAKFAYNAYLALLFPGQLDYGEGIVWQQAVLIPGPRMYGDLQRYPFLVFHYPPVYHLIVHGLAGLGVPWLVAGRLISMLAAVALSGLAAAIVWEHARRDSEQSQSPWVGLLAAAFAGMIVVAFGPFQFWAYTMRVDMSAAAFEFLGMYLGLLSLRKRPLIYLSALSFVLAVYTKPTMIAGAIATLAVLLLHMRARAIRAAAVASLAGLLAFAVLMVATGGGFARHVILYNVNSYSLSNAYDLLLQPDVIPSHLGYLLISILTVVLIGARCFRRPLREMPPGHLLVLFYFILTTASLIAAGKIGANTNYLIPWFGSWALLIGVALMEAGRKAEARGQPVALIALFVLLIIQALAAPKFGQKQMVDLAFRREYSDLVRMIADARKPVFSDDMVLLMQAEKEVPWEPAIISELTRKGLFDERKIIDMIDTHALAFAVVTGNPGDNMFDARYSPAVAAALRRAYPFEKKMAGMRVLEVAANKQPAP